MEYDDLVALVQNIHCYADLYRPIPIDNPFYLLFWLISDVTILYLLRRLIARPDNPKIQFVIPDFWAATLALLPSFFLMLNILDEDRSVKWRQVGLFLLTFASTASGIYAWLMLSLPKPGENITDRWSHFISVLGGGFVGLLGVFFSGFVFELLPFWLYALRYTPHFVYYVIYGWVGLCLLMPPLFFVSAICLYIYKRAYEVFVKELL